MREPQFSPGEQEFLFVYGTLLVPEVLEKITGQKYAMTAAELSGYKRYSLRGRVYPGIVKEEGAVVNGMLLALNGNIGQFDLFEGDEYFRESVYVMSGGRIFEAQTYVLKEKYRYLLDAGWSLQKFCENELGIFLSSEIL